MLFGASYYWEYQPYERLEEDVRLMREAGFTWVRMADSIWSLVEPEEGRFEFDWLRRVLDALHGGGIRAVLITSTYAIPPWLHRKHPEIMAVYSQTERATYGGRQNVNICHPAYRYYAERIIRKVVGELAPHPAVIGFQVDNETGSGMLANRDVFQRFVEHLKTKFGSVDRLNAIWGLTYWSQRLGDWTDLWPPEPRVFRGPGASGNTNPGYDLEWRRFQSALTTEFLAWQVGIVREYLRPDQFITHDVIGWYGRPDADHYQIGQIVDVIAINPYHPTQDALALPATEEEERAAEEGDAGASGPWPLFHKGDLARGWGGGNFLVTELNALAIGGSHSNYPAYDGQWRLAAYTNIARGANALAYWHWHSLHYGCETHWCGVLNHDLEPNRCYREISRIGEELRRFGDLLTDLRPDEDVALLYSEDSRYAMEFQPCLTLPGRGDPDQYSYQRIFDTCYRAFFDARAQAAIVHPPHRFEPIPLVVVPALFVADDTLLERLVAYAKDGGHLLLTFRCGYLDEYARARWVRAPGPLRQAVGASYQEYSNLQRPLALRGASDDLVLPADARAEAWADGLELEGATPLAWYDHPHFGRFPAIVTHSFGRGQVTYLGTLPNRPLGQALAAWTMAKAGVRPPMPDLPRSVRLSTARSRDGRRLWFFTNWSFTPQIVRELPVRGVELFGDAAVSPGGSLQLGAWDVRIVVEE